MDWEAAGSSVVSWEWETATVRASSRMPYGPRDLPPFTAAARVTRITIDSVKVTGLCGELNPRHFWLFAMHLKKRGIRWLYAERLGPHVVPQGEVVPAGDFRGWWRLDLDKLQERRRANR